MERIISFIIIPCLCEATLFSTVGFVSGYLVLLEDITFHMTLINQARALMMSLCTGRTMMNTVTIFRRCWLHWTKRSATSIRRVSNFWALLCEINPQGSHSTAFIYRSDYLVLWICAKSLQICPESDCLALTTHLLCVKIILALAVFIHWYIRLWVKCGNTLSYCHATNHDNSTYNR